MSRSPKKGRRLFRVLGRLVLVAVTAAILVTGAAGIFLNQIFNGPSPAARDALTLSMLDSGLTVGIPGLFLEDAQIQAIRESATAMALEDISDPSLITCNPDSDLWQDYPEGIRAEDFRGDGFTAHILMVRSAGQVYLSHSAEGSKIAPQLKAEGAAAGIYASDGSGLVISQGNALPGAEANGGFCGFNSDNVLILAGSMTQDEARELAIRDGCGCELILILNGQINEGAYNASSGFGPRVCIGQRTDGSVVMLTIDGLSADSIGGTYRDCIDILYEYGCVNACSLEGIPAAMLFDGRMIHSDSLPRAESAVLPDFWMIRPGKEG